MESWAFIGFFVASAVTLLIALFALVLDIHKAKKGKGEH